MHRVGDGNMSSVMFLPRAFIVQPLCFLSLGFRTEGTVLVGKKTAAFEDDLLAYVLTAPSISLFKESYSVPSTLFIPSSSSFNAHHATETAARRHAAVCEDQAHEGHCAGFEPDGDYVYNIFSLDIVLESPSLTVPQQCTRRFAGWDTIRVMGPICGRTRQRTSRCGRRR